MTATTVPELLYHTTLTVIDLREAPSQTKQSFYVLGTHGDLAAATAFVKTALQSQGFEPDDFVAYEERKPAPLWSRDDGVIVHAKTPAGQEFLLGLDAKTNEQGLHARHDGTLVLPNSASALHYVVQSEVSYSPQRASHCHRNEIAGCYSSLEQAVQAGRNVLHEVKDDFAQYDERPDLEEDTSEWPFGEDVLVHAISQTGENFTVAITTVPGHGGHPKLQQAEAGKQ